MPTIVFPARAGARGGPPQQALARAAAAAGKAPSVGQSRALRWRISETRGDLLVRHDCHDPATLVDGGAALNHALVALAGQGAAWTCERFPWDADAELIATLRITGFGRPDPEQVRAYQTISLRAVSSPMGRVTVPPFAIERMRRAVADRGARLTPSMARPSDLVHGTVAADPPGPLGWLTVGEALSALTLTGVMERLFVRAHPSPDDAFANIVVEIGVPGREQAGWFTGG